MKPILSVKEVTAGYGDRPVLHGISLNVYPGEKLLLMGQNGSGKTTLLNVLAGVLPVIRGTVLFKGRDLWTGLGKRRGKAPLGFLMQTRNVFPSLTVEENLHLSYWRGDGEYTERREWLLSLFPMLRRLLRTRAGLLSGGERQALAISMVLIRPSDLVLFDEPTAGLSPSNSVKILEALHGAQEMAGFSAVIVEHNLKAVYRWVSRAAVMSHGRIIAEEDVPSRLLSPQVLEKYYFE